MAAGKDASKCSSLLSYERVAITHTVWVQLGVVVCDLVVSDQLSHAPVEGQPFYHDCVPTRRSKGNRAGQNFLYMFLWYGHYLQFCSAIWSDYYGLLLWYITTSNAIQSTAKRHYLWCYSINSRWITFADLSESSWVHTMHAFPVLFSIMEITQALLYRLPLGKGYSDNGLGVHTHNAVSQSNDSQVC